MSAREQRWPVGGYAPGGYMCKCLRCGDQFTGDKRATVCLPCGVKNHGYRVLAPGELDPDTVTAVIKRLEGFQAPMRDAVAIATLKDMKEALCSKSQ